MLLFVDFESHYDKDYSLSKMPTQAYLRDPRFKCLGCAVGTLGGTMKYVQPEDLQALFDKIPWHKVTAVAHNALFDLALLADMHGHVPARALCTQAMATYAVAQGWLPPETRVSLQALQFVTGITKGDTAGAVAAGGQDLADYALADLHACMALYNQFAHKMPEVELDIIDLHIKCSINRAMVLDKPALGVLANTPPDPFAVHLRKNELFARALREYGIEPPRKNNKSQGYAFAKTDAFMQSLEEHDDLRVQVLHRLRTEGTSNIVRSRAQRMLSCVPGESTSFGAPLRYHGAFTGRSTASDKLNMLNMPSRHPQQLALRRCLKAPEGYKLLTVDSAQIEVRVLAWLACNAPVLATIREGRDLHSEFANTIYGPGVWHKGTRQRMVAKSARLALQYAQGANGFSVYCQRSGVTLEPYEAERIVRVYRDSNPTELALWHRLHCDSLEGGIRLPSGRKLVYQDVQVCGRDATYLVPAPFRSPANKVGRDKLWPGQAANHTTQATARDIVMLQTLEASKRMPYARLALSVYDEAVWAVPDDCCSEYEQIVKEEFTRTPVWAVELPLDCDVHIVSNYGEAK